MNNEELALSQLKKKKEFLYLNLGIINNFLNDEKVSEIFLNQDQYVWLKTVNGEKIKTDSFISEIEAKRIVEVISTFNEKSFNRENSIIEATLPKGERFSAMGFESTQNKITFSLRKSLPRVIPIEKYIENGQISLSKAEYLKKAVNDRKNILVVGATGSGKTTFTNSLLNELSNTKERIIVLETNTRELKINAPDVNYFTTSENQELIDLLRFTMRMNPDRIMVGEIRTGVETTELLKAWNSGHEGGITTIHANSNYGGLIKLEQYLSELFEKDQNLLIAETINVIVNIIVTSNGRIIKEVSEVKGFDKDKKEYILENID